MLLKNPNSSSGLSVAIVNGKLCFRISTKAMSSSARGWKLSGIKKILAKFNLPWSKIWVPKEEVDTHEPDMDRKDDERWQVDTRNKELPAWVRVAIFAADAGDVDTNDCLRPFQCDIRSFRVKTDPKSKKEKFAPEFICGEYDSFGTDLIDHIESSVDYVDTVVTGSST